MALKKLAAIVRRVDFADVLLFAGLISLTIGAGLAHPVLAFLVFGLGAFYLGHAAARTPPPREG